MLSSAIVPLGGWFLPCRTGHPFAVSGFQEPSQKIEFVFSASPETIRREPRELELLRSVANRQDLAACASMILMFLPFPYQKKVLGCCCPVELLSRHEVLFSPLYGQHVADHLAGNGQRGPVLVSFSQFSGVDHCQLVALARR
jgi:hypothetical protein